MKRITIYISVSILCFASFCACSRFLDEVNPSGLDTIYSTENELEAAAEGVVSGFLGWYGVTGETVQFFSMPSGICHWGKYKASYLTNNSYLATLQFSHYSTTSFNSDFFSNLYKAVYIANKFLTDCKKSPVSDEYKKPLEAEVKFYRAVAYFSIVRIWGDCPLRLEPSTAGNSTNCPRTAYYNVYAQIVKDLEEAERDMRSPLEVKMISPNMPRPCKYAATAYLSSVYTQIGSLLASPDDNFWNTAKEGRNPDFSAIGVTSAEDAYNKALLYAQKLIPGSATKEAECQYALLDKFGDNFNFDPDFSRSGYTAWINPEQIFTIPVTTTSDVNTCYAKYILPQYPEGTSATIDNTQAGRLRPGRFFFQKWCETYPGKQKTDGSLYLSSSDPRMNDTFYFGTMRYCNDSGVLTMYPNSTSTSSDSSSYPYFKKPASRNYNVNTTDADFSMMRFAEVYFNAIEAAAYLGWHGSLPNGQALAREYMERIHERARQSVPDGEEPATQPSWEDVSFASYEQMRDRIFWERMFEFTGEYLQEYFNTHRHGAKFIVENISKPKNQFLLRDTEKGLIGRFYPNGFKYSEDPETVRCGLLVAFPAEEMRYNSGISETDQNDYWYGL